VHIFGVQIVLYRARRRAITHCPLFFATERGGGMAEPERGRHGTVHAQDKSTTLYFWGKTISMVVYILNRALTRALDKTPFESWHNEILVVHYFRTFDSITHVNNTWLKLRSSTTATSRPSSSTTRSAPWCIAATTQSASESSSPGTSSLTRQHNGAGRTTSTSW
jgi:hypothetical protein